MCDRIIGLEYTNKSAQARSLLVQHIIIIILFLPVSLFYNESWRLYDASSLLLIVVVDDIIIFLIFLLFISVIEGVLNNM